MKEFSMTSTPYISSDEAKAFFNLFARGIKLPVVGPRKNEKTVLICYGMKRQNGFDSYELIDMIEHFEPGRDYRTALEEMVRDGYFEKTKPPSGVEKWVITKQGIDEYRHLDELSTFLEEPKPLFVHKKGEAESFKKAAKYFREVSARMLVGDPSAPIS